MTSRSPPKPEWCIGRRYADGFREPDAAQSNAEPVVQTEFELEDGLHELAFPAPPRADASAALEDRIYPGGRTKAEWDVIARASYERAKGLPDD